MAGGWLFARARSSLRTALDTMREYYHVGMRLRNTSGFAVVASSERLLQRRVVLEDIAGELGVL